MKIKNLLIIIIMVLGITTVNLSAQTISFMCYGDGNECEVLQDLIDKFEREHAGMKVSLNKVGFEVVRDQLQTQLEAGTGPDVARVVNLAGLNQFYIDLSPHVNKSYWEQNYGKTLPWFRRPQGDNGIYGWMTQLTVTAPFVNVTKFKQAGVKLPGKGATWDDWAKATEQVKNKLGLYSAMVMDRTGHRFAAAAMSYNAKYFDRSGRAKLIDYGFKQMANRLVKWHESGIMPPDIWPAASGAKWKNGAELFVNEETLLHMSGSWQMQNNVKTIGDRFEWRVANAPCGSRRSCGSMIGGAGIVAFKHGKNPKVAAAFIDFLAQEENAHYFYSKSLQIPSHQGLQEKGVDYGDVDKVVSDGLKTYADNVVMANKTTPQALQLQAYPQNFLVYNTTVKYLSAVLTKELTLNQAYSKIEEEIKAGTQ